MKIGIVGAGLVGSTAAYALILRGVGRQIVLVDKAEDRAKAEADDLLHAVPFSHPIDVIAGEYSDLAGASLVILAAGVSQAPGESRLDLIGRNFKVLDQVVPAVLEHAPDAVLLVATNPVDVLTHLTADMAIEAGCDHCRVLGSGTTLDTARFRSLLGRALGVDSRHVHAYVIGEHGDTEVLTWSQVTVGGMPLDDFCLRNDRPLGPDMRQSIEARVRGAAYSIIEGKGATYYGIGSALARISQAVLNDERAILTVCAPTASTGAELDVTISLPRLIGSEGVLNTFPPPLDDKESDALSTSMELIRESIRKARSFEQ